jgi:hypothetical protein
VNQTFDPPFELDEGAVVGDVGDSSGDARARRILLRHVRPRILRQLLGAQRHALGLAVELQDDDFDLVSDLHQVRRMVDAPPGHVRHVQEPVETAEVHERAIVGQVLDRAAENPALFEKLQGLLLAGLLLDLDDGLAREDDVAALLVDRDDLEVEVFAPK